ADDEAAIQVPTAGRIWGAAKLSGQLARHFSIAALDAITAAQDVEVLRTPVGKAPEVRHRLADPLSNYAVLRLRGDFGQNAIGVTATSVNRFEEHGAA